MAFFKYEPKPMYSKSVTAKPSQQIDKSPVGPSFHRWLSSPFRRYPTSSRCFGGKKLTTEENGCWTKNRWVFPPNHPFGNRVWNHYFHHPFWGARIFGNTQMLFWNNIVAANPQFSKKNWQVKTPKKNVRSCLIFTFDNHVSYPIYTLKNSWFFGNEETYFRPKTHPPHIVASHGTWSRPRLSTEPKYKTTLMCFPMFFPRDGPLLVINGVLTPYKWPYKWATGVITPIYNPSKWSYNPIFNW